MFPTLTATILAAGVSYDFNLLFMMIIIFTIIFYNNESIIGLIIPSITV